MQVHLNKCMFDCVYIMYVYDVYVCVYTWLCIYIYIYIYICTLCVFVCICINAYIFLVRTWLHACNLLVSIIKYLYLAK